MSNRKRKELYSFGDDQVVTHKTYFYRGSINDDDVVFSVSLFFCFPSLRRMRDSIPSCRFHLIGFIWFSSADESRFGCFQISRLAAAAALYSKCRDAVHTHTCMLYYIYIYVLYTYKYISSLLDWIPTSNITSTTTEKVFDLKAFSFAALIFGASVEITFGS